MTSDKSSNGLGHVVFNKSSRFLFGRTTDLSNHHNPLGHRVFFEKFKGVDEGGADDGVSPYSKAGGLSKAQLAELVDCFIGEGAAPGDNPDTAG